MTYQALARTWRPKQFGEVVGQEHVTDVLIHALDNDRVHHALLFSGTRGVGKTTLGRIVAKALNCEQGISSHPCGVCAHCKAVDEGRFIDLREVDAASRTRVDDTREMLDNVQYAPAAGRYKVYLIDEVHMLSAHSFNALLKTLEEPPAHVQFLLATTDPQKLPVTVLSRCLQFHLRALPSPLIVDRLKVILQAEQISFDDPALQLLARAAAGSLRDGLSLLDQAIAHGGGEVRQDSVRSMLGLIESRYIIDLIQMLATGNASGLLGVSARIAERAADYSEVLDSLLRALYQLALVKSVPEIQSQDNIVEPEFADLAHVLQVEDVQLYYQIALLGKRDLPLAPDPRTGFEMCLLRMLAFRPVEPDTGTGDSGRSPSSGTVETPKLPSQQASEPAKALDQWSRVVAALELKGVTRELARNSVLVKQDEKQLELMIPESMRYLATPARIQKLGAALSRYSGSVLQVRVEFKADLSSESPASQDRRLARERQRRTEAAVDAHPVVQQLRQDFDALLVPGSVHPVDSLSPSQSNGECA